MDALIGPRIYYSLFGARGLLLGAAARLFRKPIKVAVAVPGIRHPLFLRLRTTDVALCREIFLNEVYDSGFPPAPRVVVDAGANIGLSTVFFANKFPQAEIVAIEPEPSNFAMLRDNVAPYPNVTPVQAALWKEDRELNLFDTGEGQTTFQVRPGEASPREGNSRPNRVQGITLQKLMANHDLSHIDLLKMDIEGAEKDIFEHSQPWIDDVEIIAVEFHDWIHDGSSQIVRQAVQYFPHEWQRGEITYFSKGGKPENGASAPASMPKFPLKILHTCR
jgi:FkbM family methyltransferase